MASPHLDPTLSTACLASDLRDSRYCAFPTAWHPEMLDFLIHNVAGRRVDADTLAALAGARAQLERLQEAIAAMDAAALLLAQRLEAHNPGHR